MNRRETAINEAIRKMHGTKLSVWVEALNDLIAQAEAGNLREPLPRWCTGINGTQVVHPDGTVEHIP